MREYLKFLNSLCMPYRLPLIYNFVFHPRSTFRDDVTDKASERSSDQSGVSPRGPGTLRPVNGGTECRAYTCANDCSDCAVTLPPEFQTDLLDTSSIKSHLSGRRKKAAVEDEFAEQLFVGRALKPAAELPLSLHSDRRACGEILNLPPVANLRMRG